MSHLREARHRFGPVGYLAMSSLLIWHSIAMVAGASSEIALADSARALLHPYLTLFRLDNHWGFFAPNVGTGSRFNYIIEDAAGGRHSFIPAEKLSRFDPASIWERDRYKMVMDYPDTYGEAAVAALCQEHAALQPVSVTLQELEQKEFLAGDHLDGKRPFDPEFVDTKTLKTIRCPGK